jgi:acyl-CoA thioesterase
LPRNVHDIEWLGLGLTGDGLRASMHVQERHLNPLGSLYGGAAVATAVTLMEEATGRDAAWATVQFASTCKLGDVLDLHVTVSASGRRTSQLRVAATLGDAEVFVALGAVRAQATGGPPGADGSSGGRRRDPGATAQWLPVPVVPPPEECPPLVLPQSILDSSHLGGTEMRIAVDASEEPTAHAAMWCRPPGGGRLSAAVLGWQADMVGFAIAPEMEAMGSTSLDNTVRFGPPADPVDRWVLADIRGQLASGGVGHGTVDLWSAGGTLLAAASQSCILRGGTPAG